MRNILPTEIKKERCNAAALGAFNASVGNSEPQVNTTDLVKKRDWNGLVMEILKKGDKTDFSRFTVDQETSLRGYMNAYRAAEDWRKNRDAGRDEIQMNFKYFNQMKDQKLEEIKRKFKLKDLQ